jgi:hypothetical protein
MKALILKLLPYLISIFGGAVIYVLAEIHLDQQEGIYALIIGMASGLLSIPLIFICYEGVNRVCSKNLRRTLLEHLSFEVNSIIIDILGDLKVIIRHRDPLCHETLERLLRMTAEEIEPRIVFVAKAAEGLEKAKDDLLTTVTKHTYGHSDLLSDQETETLLCIRRMSGTIAKEIRYQLELSETDKDAQHLASYIQELLGHISEWLDESENEAVLNHLHFCFLGR